jgi:hypothetical protein
MSVCWLISIVNFKAPVGERISIKFDDRFQIGCNQFEKDSPCDQDWLEIRIRADKLDLGGPRYSNNSTFSLYNY